MNKQVYTFDKQFRRLIVYTARPNGRILCTTTVRPSPKMDKATRREVLIKALAKAAPKLKWEEPQ